MPTIKNSSLSAASGDARPRAVESRTAEAGSTLLLSSMGLGSSIVTLGALISDRVFGFPLPIWFAVALIVALPAGIAFWVARNRRTPERLEIFK